MYIVSYVQLTVIQQSIATTDYPPFYCNRKDCLCDSVVAVAPITHLKPAAAKAFLSQYYQRRILQYEFHVYKNKLAIVKHEDYIFFNWSHPDVFHLILKSKVCQKHNNYLLLNI